VPSSHYPFQIDDAYDESGNLLPRLEVGFSSVTIKHNLLGRDFFSLLQIGFRERRQTIYVSLEP